MDSVQFSFASLGYQVMHVIVILKVSLFIALATICFSSDVRFLLMRDMFVNYELYKIVLEWSYAGSALVFHYLNESFKLHKRLEGYEA